LAIPCLRRDIAWLGSRRAAGKEYRNQKKSAHDLRIASAALLERKESSRRAGTFDRADPDFRICRRITRKKQVDLIEPRASRYDSDVRNAGGIYAHSIQKHLKILVASNLSGCLCNEIWNLRGQRRAQASREQNNHFPRASRRFCCNRGPIEMNRKC